jgi:hypothetical protein
VKAMRQSTLYLFALLLALATAAPAQSSDLWVQLSKIGAVNGQNSNLPPSVAVSGQTVVVSGSLGNDGSLAYVFVKPANGWTNMKLVARLRSTAGKLISTASVATDGQTVVVGDTQCSVAQCRSKGTLYVFVEPSGGWTNMTQTATLTGSNTLPGDLLGWSVAMSDNTIVAGAVAGRFGGSSGPGAAYVFVKPTSGWTNMTETAKLTASDGAKDDEFGYCVAIAEGTIAVGAPQHFESGLGTGKAYVFVKPAAGWTSATQTAELTSTSSAPGDNLGASIAVLGNTVVAGQPSLAFINGVVCVFVRPSGGWSNMTQTATLSEAKGNSGGGLGFSVGIGDNLVVAGAPFYQARNLGGALFIFNKPATGWTDMSSNAAIFASDAKHESGFGYSMAASGKLVVAGPSYNRDDFNVTPPPSVYLFQVPARP